jgi:excisionase family DNA binding protein
MVLFNIFSNFEVKMIMKYYNVEEAASVLRVTKTTIRRWCKSGMLNSKKIGKKWLIEEDELNLFISSDSKLEAGNDTI